VQQIFIGLKTLQDKDISHYLNLHHTGNAMAFLEKLLEFIVYLLIVTGIVWFLFGCYTLIDLFFMKG
jgi:hypothetical protein